MVKYAILLCFLLALNNLQGQQSEAAEEIAMETSIEKIGDYAQFAPTAFSLITVLAKGDKDGKNGQSEPPKTDESEQCK